MRRRSLFIPVVVASVALWAAAAPAEAQLGAVTQPVVDATGQVIGVVNQIGQVVDPSGQVIGTVDPVTGNVTDEMGNIIGQIDGGGGGGGSDPGGNPGGGGGGGGSNPQQPAAPQEQQPRVVLGFSMGRTQRYRIAQRRGVALNARCSRQCSVLVALALDAKTAKKVRLRSTSGAAIIGSAASNSAGRITMGLRSEARKRLGRYFQSTRYLRKLRAREIRARRASRQRSRSASARRKQRIRASKLRRRRIAVSRRKLRVTVLAIAFDAQGRESALRTKRITLKR